MIQVSCAEHGMMDYDSEKFWWECKAPGCPVPVVYKEDAGRGPTPGCGWMTTGTYEAQGDPFPDLVPPAELPPYLMHEKQLIRFDGTLLWHSVEPQGVVFEHHLDVPIEGAVVLRARHLPGGEWFALAYFPEGYPGPRWEDVKPFTEMPEPVRAAIRRLEGWQGGETEFVALEGSERAAEIDQGAEPA